MLDYMGMVRPFKAVSKHLTGQKCEILFTNFASGRGRVVKFGDKFYIEISTKCLDLDEAFSVLLHECGHIFAHGKMLADLAAHPGKSAAGEYGPISEEELEDQAQNLADAWFSFARDQVIYLTPYRMCEALMEL